MQYTTNYNLPKAELTDAPPDITFVGEGFDLVDEALKEHDDSFAWHADRKNELQESINVLAEQIATKTWTPFCVNSGALDSNGKPALMGFANDVSLSTELAFVQPVLTSNGTMGGTAFAVTANENASGVYNLFGSSATGWTNNQAPTESAPAEITIYNPNALKLTSIDIQNGTYSDNVWSKMTLYGSNTNGSWTTISTHNNNIRTTNTWVSLGVNPNAYYKYYKISFTSNTANTNISIQKINLTGTYISTHTGGRVTFTGTVIATTAQGENFTANEIKDLDLSSVTASKVYIYLGRNGAPTYTAGVLHVSATTPTEFAAGDVWFKTLEPLAAYQYINSAWSEINLAPVGEVTMDGAGKITAVTTYPYNQNGYTVNVGTQATASTFGLVRTAGAEDETDCQCNDAAVTPENLYKLANYRLANTAYEVGDVVACPYHAELQLKCTTAGTTSAAALDTANVQAGNTITDGDAKWKVVQTNFEVVPIASGGTGATTAANARQNLGLGITAIPANSDLDDYTTVGKYSCWTTQDAQSLANNPMSDLTTGIVLEVISGNSNSNSLQIVYGTLVRGMYIRRCTNGSWNTWKNINNGIQSGYLANSGYVIFENSLVFAWKRATISDSGTLVSKPTSFTTYVAVAGQIQTMGADDLVASWATDKTTTTTDTFTGSKSEDNVVIFWVGYKS